MSLSLVGCGLIAVDQDWLDVDQTSLELLAGGADERIITVAVNDNALTLFDGVNSA